MPDWFLPQAKAENTALVRLARVIHWLGYAAASLLILLMVFGSIFGEPSVQDIFEILVWILGLATAGRAARYIIANE